ncbi:bifunctional ornithine acetyltransferase/N-acetylglutamate synthase [Bacillus velezensis]|nr:bifunctional ornithine acetyltransferase/N-acetylglutamate synthase [Bacillus velezensis]
MIQLSEEITKIKGGVSSPKGFEAKGVHCGLRYSKKISERLSAKRLQSVRGIYAEPFSGAAESDASQPEKEGVLQAVIVNSAIANACTGDQGLKDAYEMRDGFASQLGIEPELVAVSSTGVIGELLDMKNSSGH